MSNVFNQLFIHLLNNNNILDDLMAASMDQWTEIMHSGLVNNEVT